MPNRMFSDQIFDTILCHLWQRIVHGAGVNELCITANRGMMRADNIE